MGEITKLKQQGTMDSKQHFLDLRARGYSIRHIARELERSPATVLKWENDFNEEISKLKAVQLEALYEQYNITKQHRLKGLANQLKAIQDELSTRDISDVPTDKLFDLNLKYLERIKKDYIEPKFLFDTSRAITKLNSRDISAELHKLLLRFRAGTVDAAEANRETFILQGMLKAIEQGDIQEKVEELKTLLEGSK